MLKAGITYQVMYPEERFAAIQHITCMANWQHAYVHYVPDYGKWTGSPWVSWAGIGEHPKDVAKHLCIHEDYLVAVVNCVCPMRTLNSRGCQCGGK